MYNFIKRTVLSFLVLTLFAFSAVSFVQAQDFVEPVPYGLSYDINMGSCAFTKNTLNAIQVKGATPYGNVALVVGLEEGPLAVSAAKCKIIKLGVRKQPRLLGVFKADKYGMVNVQIPVDNIEGYVKGYLQFVDVASCMPAPPKVFHVYQSDIETDDLDGDKIPNCFDRCPEEGLPMGPFEILGRDGCIFECKDIRPDNATQEEFMYCFPEE